MFLLFFYLFLVLIISFLCSFLESILLSIPLPFLKAKEAEGNKYATKLIKLKENIDRPLSAILSLNTIAHTVGAAGVGVQTTIVFGEAYFGWASAILTFLILVFTEIIPKTIGARYAKKFISSTYILIQSMIVIAYPLVLISAYFSKLFSNKNEEESTSREEISALANMGVEKGVFQDKENAIIQNLIRLRQIRVSEIMTPRVVIVFADENMLVGEFLKDKRFLFFSRIPVYSGNTENVTGYVLRHTVFEKFTSETASDMTLREFKRSILFVPESEPVLDVWENMMEKKEHITLVVDEYGGVDGLVTLEDVIETLLGTEIVDEKDAVSDMQEYARERWRQRRSKYDILE
jgi:CBS domain containing-hemolysin-like protein